MTTYVMLATWTDRGLQAAADGPKRLNDTKKILADMGGQMQALYLTMGQYDLVGIFDAPDDAIAARFSLMLGQLGHVRTTTMKAFPEEAYRRIVDLSGTDKRHTAVREWAKGRDFCAPVLHARQ